MSALNKEMIRAEILAGIVHAAVEEGVLLPTLGSLKCLPLGNSLVPISGNIAIELLEDVPEAADIDEDIECVAGIIKSRTKKAKWVKDKGSTLLWGYSKEGRWFWIEYYYCLECDVDENNPVIYNYFSKYCSLQELIKEGAVASEVVNTFYSLLLKWRRISSVMAQAWEQAELAFTEDL